MRVEALHPSALPQVPALSARAFDDYPYMAELLPGPPGDARRAAVSRRVYTPTVADCLRHGVVDAAFEGERLVGYCAWLPPEAQPLGLRRNLPYLAALAPILRYYPHRARLVVQSVLRLQRSHPHRPHWYLEAIAVDPEHQGRGVGKAMIVPGLRRADARGQACFLETTRPSARAWYERLGFAVHRSEPAFDGGPMQWYQWREPRRP